MMAGHLSPAHHPVSARKWPVSLPDKKFDLILVARNGMALEQLSDELVSNHDVKIRVNAI